MDERSVSVLSWERDESPVSVVELVLGHNRLDDIAVHRAIGRRIVESGVSQPVDKVVRDARSGEPWAVDLIQTLDLPAPTDRLTMPVQDLGQNRVRSWIDTVLARFAPRGKHHA